MPPQLLWIVYLNLRKTRSKLINFLRQFVQPFRIEAP
jgi:hypothetical protein